MKTYPLIFLISIGLALIGALLYFLNLPLIVLVIIVAFFTTIGYVFISKWPQAEQKIFTENLTFSSLTKDFLYPKLLLPLLAMPFLVSEYSQFPFLYILTSIFGIIVLSLYIIDIPKSSKPKIILFWIFLSILGIVINFDFFCMSLRK